MNPRRKITLEGASGARYRFKVHALGASLPASGGIYLLTRSREAAEGRRRHARIFAGHSADLATHVTEQQAICATHAPNCVCVLAEPVESERVRIESDLLAKYRPPCNPAGA